jgi:hypothetical protein
VARLLLYLVRVSSLTGYNCRSRLTNEIIGLFLMITMPYVLHAQIPFSKEKQKIDALIKYLGEMSDVLAELDKLEKPN